MPSRVFIKTFIIPTTPYTRVAKTKLLYLGSFTRMNFLCTLNINEMRNGDFLFGKLVFNENKIDWKG